MSIRTKFEERNPYHLQASVINARDAPDHLSLLRMLNRQITKDVEFHERTMPRTKSYNVKYARLQNVLSKHQMELAKKKLQHHKSYNHVETS